MDNVSPELHLLLALLRSALGTGKSDAPPPDAIDWTRFLALVVRHRVGAYLHSRAAGPVARACPAPVARRLHAIADATLQRALVHAAEQIRLAQALAGAGIDVLAVKGLVLAQELYHGLGRRHVGDIDLLIRPRDAARADAVLHNAGLERTRPSFALTPRQMMAYQELKPEFEYQRRPQAMRIELLWRLEGLRERATEEAWQRAIATQIGGYPARTLPPEINALYLLQHGARHAWFRLFWLVDVALLLRHSALDWNALATRARELQIERPLMQGAALARDLLGVPLPAALAARVDAPSFAALVAEARRQIGREPQHHEPLAEWFRQTAYRVRLQETTAAKLAILKPHLFSPLNWQTWPISDRWFFLYYPASPFLWMWRRARRSRDAGG